MSRDARLMTRSVFSFWQVLSEVGGLNGFLISIVALAVSIFTFNQDENYLAGKLYRPQSTTGEKEILNPRKQWSLAEYLQDTLPHCCLLLCCLRPRRKDKILSRARDSFAEEIDVVHLLHQLHFLNAIVPTQAIPLKTREKLKHKSKLIALKEDSSESTVSEFELSRVEHRLADHSSVDVSDLTAPTTTRK